MVFVLLKMCHECVIKSLLWAAECFLYKRSLVLFFLYPFLLNLFTGKMAFTQIVVFFTLVNLRLSASETGRAALRGRAHAAA